jgi:NADP-dependent 3-hydroxy acid dehydrogenase YdfG
MACRASYGSREIGQEGINQRRHEAPPQSIYFAIVMSNVGLITGSSCGLGRGLTEVFLETGHRVLATAGQPEQWSDLRVTHKNRLLTVKLDVTPPVEAQQAVAAAI